MFKAAISPVRPLLKGLNSWVSYPSSLSDDEEDSSTGPDEDDDENVTVTELLLELEELLEDDDDDELEPPAYEWCNFNLSLFAKNLCIAGLCFGASSL